MVLLELINLMRKKEPQTLSEAQILTIDHVRYFVCVPGLLLEILWVTPEVFAPHVRVFDPVFMAQAVVMGADGVVEMRKKKSLKLCRRLRY